MTDCFIDSTYMSVCFFRINSLVIWLHISHSVHTIPCRRWHINLYVILVLYDYLSWLFALNISSPSADNASRGCRFRMHSPRPFPFLLAIFSPTSFFYARIPEKSHLGFWVPNINISQEVSELACTFNSSN